jgi:hypothetical protein
MTARLTFFFIAAFWVAMNVLLWRAEYGSRGGEISVPADLVWRKILTAPDAETLTIFQGGQRSGFCEFSTSIEQAMATIDEDKPPPEGLVARAGYQIRISGTMSFGDFTNRVRFDSQIGFSPKRAWREFNLKLSSHFAAVEINSFATKQTVHLKITGDGVPVEHDFTFADLQNPNTLLRTFARDSGSGFLDGLILDELNLPVTPQTSIAPVQSLHWEAHRKRLMINHEPVNAYRLETNILGNSIVIYVSTLGEILRIELPGGVTAILDE